MVLPTKPIWTKFYIYRTMLGLQWIESCKQHFADLGILTVYGVYIYRTIIYLLKNSAATIKQNQIHQHNARNKKNFRISTHNKELFKKKPTYVGAKFFNNLPNWLKAQVNEPRFIKILREY